MREEGRRREVMSQTHLPTNTSLNTYFLMRSERGRKKKRSHESNTLTYEHVTQYLQPNEKWERKEEEEKSWVKHTYLKYDFLITAWSACTIAFIIFCLSSFFLVLRYTLSFIFPCGLSVDSSFGPSLPSYYFYLTFIDLFLLVHIHFDSNWCHLFHLP